MKFLTTATLASALLAGAAFIGMAAETPYIGYRVTKVVTLPGKNPRWDHMSVDPVNRHLFIGRRGDGLTVVNIDTGEVSSVAETKGTNGAWAAPDLGIGLSDNGTAADVTVFDLKTLAVKGKIKVPKETDGVWYDPATKLGYVNNGDEGSITLIDPVAMKAGETIALNSKKPEFSAVDGKGRAFVALQDKNQLAVVDLKAKKLANTWNVDCIQPTGMYYEPNSDRLFVPCRGNKPVLAVVDATSGKTVYSFPIGLGVDAVAFNPTEKLIMTSNGVQGTMSVFKQDSKDAYHLVETVATRLGARTMALDPKTGKAFTVTAEYVQPASQSATEKQPPTKWVSDTFQLITLERMPIE
jgi:DNA-binding beta-propeller fold protein YncE